MEALSLGDYGIMGATLLVVLAVVKLLEKILVPLVLQRAGRAPGQPNGRERRSLDVVTLDGPLKAAISDTKRDAADTTATLKSLNNTSIEMLVVLRQIAANGHTR